MHDFLIGRVARIAVLLAPLLLAACGGVARNDTPAQVEERGGGATTQPATVPGGPQIAAYTPPAQPRVARPVPKRAVAVLMRRAEDQSRSGDLDGASASLERAMRIEPGDALLWQRLAEVRLAQQRHNLVVQLAAKSNALATPGDTDLRQRNWRLIASARRAMGDQRGALEAERNAARP